MDSPDRAASERAALWPGVWIPLVIFVVGLSVTALAAHAGAGLARDLAEARYHTQHQRLVSRLLASAPAFAGGTIRPSEFLSSVFGQAVPAELGLRVDTLERHTKHPLFQVHAQRTIDPTLALRTEVVLGQSRWMLTSLPSPSVLSGTATRTKEIIWGTGLIFSALASMLPLILCRRLHQQSLKLVRHARFRENADQQITNLQVEKSILHQALADSEQRSRDLIALSGAIIFELDEAGCVGFSSPQIATLLGCAPADLIGQPFDRLAEPSCRDNVKRTMNAARAEQAIQRIDLSLLHKNTEDLVSVVLRVRAQQDPVYGFTGYRLSALPLSG
jgi:PAS domain-containing protein